MIQLPAAMPTSVKQYFSVARKVLNRNAGPYLAILILSSSSAGLFYVLEHTQPRIYDKRVHEDYKCIGNYTSFAPSVFFVLSLCSTIGFGTLYPCTTATRVLSIPVLMLGITLFLYVVADIGEKTDRIFRRLYNAYRRKMRHWRRKRALTSKIDKLLVTPGVNTRCNNGDLNGAEDTNLTLNLFRINEIPFIDEDDKTFRTLSSERASSMLKETEYSDLTSLDTDHQEDLPVWVGILLTMSCVAVSALYYALAEDYSSSEAIYFSFLAFFAGDFIAYNFSYALPMFLFIFGGFSMISMTINTALANFKNLIHRVKTRAKEHIEAAQVDENGNMIITDPQHIINELMEEFGAEWVLSFIPAKDLESLHEYCEETKERVQEVRTVEKKMDDMKQAHEKIVRELQETPRRVEVDRTTSVTGLPKKLLKQESYAQTVESSFDSDPSNDSHVVTLSVVSTNCASAASDCTQTESSCSSASATQTLHLAVTACSQANMPPPAVPSADHSGQTTPISTADQADQRTPREEANNWTQTCDLPNRTVGTQFPGKFTRSSLK